MKEAEKRSSLDMSKARDDARAEQEQQSREELLKIEADLRQAAEQAVSKLKSEMESLHANYASKIELLQSTHDAHVGVVGGPGSMPRPGRDRAAPASQADSRPNAAQVTSRTTSLGGTIELSPQGSSSSSVLSTAGAAPTAPPALCTPAALTSVDARCAQALHGDHH